MNLHLDHNNSPASHTERRSLWNDNLAWWVNCLGIERYWFFDGPDLTFAQARRDALLSALIAQE